MINEENLEEIFWKGGKFLDKENKEILAKPIGMPTIIKAEQGKDLKYFIISFCNITYGENAYIKGEGFDFREERYKRRYYNIPIQFYKI